MPMWLAAEVGSTGTARQFGERCARGRKRVADALVEMRIPARRCASVMLVVMAIPVWTAYCAGTARRPRSGTRASTGCRGAPPRGRDRRGRGERSRARARERRRWQWGLPEDRTGTIVVLGGETNTGREALCREAMALVHGIAVDQVRSEGWVDSAVIGRWGPSARRRQNPPCLPVKNASDAPALERACFRNICGSPQVPHTAPRDRKKFTSRQ